MPVPLTLQELVELVAPNEWPSVRAAIERVDTSRRVREAIRSDIDIRSGGFTAVDPDFAEHLENVLPWSFALEQTALPLLDIVRDAVRIAMTEASVKVTGRRDGAAPEPLRRADIMAAEIDLREMALCLGDQVWKAVEVELPAPEAGSSQTVNPLRVAAARVLPWAERLHAEGTIITEGLVAKEFPGLTVRNHRALLQKLPKAWRAERGTAPSRRRSRMIAK